MIKQIQEADLRKYVAKCDIAKQRNSRHNINEVKERHIVFLYRKMYTVEQISEMTGTPDDTVRIVLIGNRQIKIKAGAERSQMLAGTRYHQSYKHGNHLKNKNFRCKDMTTSEYKSFRLDCMERDDFACVECGGDTDLCVHHIESYRDFPDKRHNTDNGITLCDDCHKEKHKTRK